MITAHKKIDVFRAIADKNRRKMLDLLNDGEIPVNEIASHFEISLPAVSQHLKVLLSAGLVTKRAVGPLRLYRTSPEALWEVHEWTSRYERFWKRRLRNLGEYLNSKI